MKKIVTCLFCEFSCCRSCVEKYCLSHTNEPHCMECRHEWNTDFFYHNMTKIFITTRYKQHTETILLEREKSLLPFAQIEAEHLNQIDELKKEIKEGWNKYHELRHELYRKSRTLEQLKYGGVVNSESRVFTKQCPSNDCRGFLSKRWKCGLCHINVCKDCHSPLDSTDDHKCDPELVQNVIEISKSTRGCPSCGTRIFKIEGCDQMFCTNCFTGFSWTSGKIERGIIHNPHYFEYQKQLRNGHVPRTIGDIRCGGLPPLHRTLTRNTEGVSYYHIVAHYEAYVINHAVDNNIHLNIDLGVKYLRKEIDEDKWKIILQRRHKKRKIQTTYIEIIDTFVVIGVELFQMYNSKKIKYKELCDRFEHVFKYSNTCIKEMNKLYGCKQQLLEI